MPEFSEVLIVLGQSEPLGAAMGEALQRAIEEDGPGQIRSRLIEQSQLRGLEAMRLTDERICPLTLDLPDWLSHPAQKVYRCCAEVAELRRRVQEWGCSTGAGNLWLPIVLTARGVLYGEAIAEEQHYTQPFPLSDRWRQPLYSLGLRLLRSLQAPPAVYLMQFGLQDEIEFDRLWPFPAAPAIASLNVQTPDLFACHWRCITGQPLRDLMIAAVPNKQEDG